MIPRRLHSLYGKSAKPQVTQASPEVARMYEDARVGAAGGVSDTSTSMTLDFYRRIIHQLFELYIEGEISLEEFVHFRSYPEVGAQLYGIGQTVKVVPSSMQTLKFLTPNSLGKFKPGWDEHADAPPSVHKQFLMKIAADFKKRGSNRTIRINRTGSKDVVSRINKLRRFVHEKMLDRHKKYMAEANVDSYKIFDIILNISNECLRKLENKNMVDTFNYEDFGPEALMSPIYLSDASVRRKSSPVYDSQTYTQREMEKVNLKRFLRDMKTNRTTHAQVVIEVFDEMADRYFKHLRPSTPDKLKQAIKQAGGVGMLLPDWEADESAPKTPTSPKKFKLLKKQTSLFSGDDHSKTGAALKVSKLGQTPSLSMSEKNLKKAPRCVFVLVKDGF